MNTTTDNNDPLQAALLEAESLMESLGGIGDDEPTTTLNNDGSFAIDSDDEQQETAVTTNTNDNSTTTGGNEAAAALHPLHEAFLMVPSPSATSVVATATAPSSTYGVVCGSGVAVAATNHPYNQMQQQQFTQNIGSIPVATAASMVPPSVVQQQQSSATQYQFQQQQQPSSSFLSSTTSVPSLFGDTTSSNTYGATTDAAVSSSSSSPSLDVLIKTSTSRFASNLANMAQRAANQVTTAVATASSSATPTGVGGGGGYQPQQQQQQFFPQQQQYPSMNYTSPTNNAATANFQQQPQPELLDDEQKMILMQSHVGKLISGERIKLFLQNIQHISDSTGLQYNSNNHNSGPDHSILWCCAITCYRVLLFSTHPIVPIYKPHDWNISCWPVPPGSNSNSNSNDLHSIQQSSTSSSSSCMILQIPLSNIDKIEKTVFTATTTATGFGSMNVGTSSGTPASSSSMTTMHVPSNMNGSSNTLSTTTIMGLIIHDKLNGRQIRFTTMNYSDTNKVFEVLHTYSFPGRRNLGYLFAFESKREEVMASIETDATTGKQQITLSPTEKRFDAMKEYQRQFTNASIVLDQGPWTIWNTINSSYQLCGSYPSILVGPITLDERLNPDKTRLVAHCATFRSEQRLPALTWCGYGGSSIWRSSQPKVGLQGNRSAADEQFFKHIIECAAAARSMMMSNNSHNNTIQQQQHQLPPRSVLIQLVGTTDLSNWMPNNVGLKILDLRPRSSAMANRTGGYGYENTSHYIGCSIQFCNIGNIHAVRDSYQKVSQLCLSTNASDLHFVQQVEDTKWLSHIRVIWAVDDTTKPTTTTTSITNHPSVLTRREYTKM